ncbi:MAG: RnfABCDGE type electron transport complex subunit G [Rhodocyclaceae bacterium]|nr:RnfABCDGE type electron transport complex subunit G [Rhodocyclaceae bacterium]
MTAPETAPERGEAAVTTARTAEPSALRISIRTAVILLLFSLVFTGLMAGTYSLTRPLVEASAQQEKLRLIGEVLAEGSYDNDLLADRLVLPAQAALGQDVESVLYRARKGGEPVALVFEAAAPDGYSGRIGLLLAVRADGRLSSVRVTGHRETPGLGDYIDPKKDKDKARPWITQFDGLGFDTVPKAQWRVRKDGGRFDQRVGATISARAVTNATGRALAWAVDRRERLFAAEAGAGFAEHP